MIAYKYSLRVVAQNITKELVRVVASGEENSMESFYKDVTDYCISKLNLKSENITKMESYFGLEPEWSHYESLFSVEQTAKGVNYLQLTYEKLNQVDAKFGVIGEGVRLSNERLQKLDSLPEIEKTLERLAQILEKIAPALEALGSGQASSKDKIEESKT